MDEPMATMSKRDAIKLTALMFSAVMGVDQMEKASQEFFMLVASAGDLADRIREHGLTKVLETIDEETIGTPDPTDCELLVIFKNQVNQAYFDLCETCKPSPSGPAVCDFGKLPQV